jgi:thymidylate synthase (FAD)
VKRVNLIASTTIRLAGYRLFDEVGFADSDDSEADMLVEFAGRNCYQSFHKPNPETASNKDYIGKNIIGKQHESVFEHASVTFLIEASRNWLLEAERHRHLSWSVLSTRYVGPGKMKVIVHPNTPEDLLDIPAKHFSVSLAEYDRLYLGSRDRGLNIKQAREVARQVLPGNTSTMALVTANIRTWRYVINLRNQEGADQEFQDIAKELLAELKYVAPNSFQDMDV